jgi:glucosamine kinase
MILIAESGSTKTDWVLVGQNNNLSYFKTMGFNPFFHASEFIAQEIKSNSDLNASSSKVTRVYFYGAGCSSKNMSSIIQKGLKQVFNNADISVDHDLLACAYATYEGEPSISCILGTGSNSCYFDGENLIEEVPAIAYVLGDEGSGSYYGKKLLRDYLYNLLPVNIKEELETQLGISKSIIFENVYMKPYANVYLASFMKFINTQYHTDYVVNMIEHGMEEFIKIHVCCYPNYKNVKTHFIGSISKIFERELRKAAELHGVKLGNIVRKPVDNLVHYHLRKLQLQ